jgi:hypothetical protein
MTAAPYNPLDKLNLAESIQRRILAEPIHPLIEDEARSRTGGAGVYAIYYTGPFPQYDEIAKRNRDQRWHLPIYVGKAIPPGGRTGGLDQAAHAVGALRDRLRRHAVSIDQAVNLELADFYFRFLVIDDVWIPLGENMLIESFRPLWNTSLSGFGSNPTGGPRATQASSRWDTLHPGRAGAGQSVGPKLDRVREIVEEYIASLQGQDGGD